MESVDLLNFANEKGHEVLQFPLPVNQSMSLQLGDRCVVGLDPGLNEQETRTCLAHELGHCEYGGFYHRDVPLDRLDRHEYRANVWAVRRVIPFAQLRRAVYAGVTELWDLADYFGVSESMVRFALTYYVERRGYRL